MYVLWAKIAHLYWSEVERKLVYRAQATLYPTKAAAQCRLDAFVEFDIEQEYRWTIEEA